MIRRPPRSTLDRSSAASDVYKRQTPEEALVLQQSGVDLNALAPNAEPGNKLANGLVPVSYTHLRAHETVLDLVCRLLLEKKTTHELDLVMCYLPSTARQCTFSQMLSTIDSNTRTTPSLM